METIDKVKDTTDWLDAPIESDKWININFDRQGNSYKTGRIWPSEDIAKNISDKYDTQCEQRFITMGDFYIIGYICGRRYLYSQHSHTIQMPVKE